MCFAVKTGHTDHCGTFCVGLTSLRELLWCWQRLKHISSCCRHIHCCTHRRKWRTLQKAEDCITTMHAGCSHGRRQQLAGGGGGAARGSAACGAAAAEPAAGAR